MIKLRKKTGKQSKQTKKKHKEMLETQPLQVLILLPHYKRNEEGDDVDGDVDMLENLDSMLLTE